MKPPTFFLIAAVLCGIAPIPASATCIMHEAKSIAKTRITLKMVGGRKTLIRTTRADGKLMLRGLKPGAWIAQFDPNGDAYPLSVGKNGKLSLIAESAKSECHAPLSPEIPPPPPVPPMERRMVRQL